MHCNLIISGNPRRPGGGGLSAGGVAEYSDFGVWTYRRLHVYLETVQDSM